MPYDVKAKHGELIALLSEQYKLYEEARSAFLSAQWDRDRERYKREKDEARNDEGLELAIRALKEDVSWEAANEDKRKMDEAGMKLHTAVKYTVKHYSYWHAGRIRAASGIFRFDWFMFMTPLCLPSYLSMDLDERKKGDDWTQAIDLADNFTDKEIKSMSGKQYAHELFKRANNLLDMKKAHAVS